jgi:hypothetical protein
VKQGVGVKGKACMYITLWFYSDIFHFFITISELLLWDFKFLR